MRRERKAGSLTEGLEKTARRPSETGYTLLLALFFAAVMIIAASMAVPNLITQDRRQKEELMIWRGEQYARAIGLYYRKTGHFPHDLEELEKGVNGIHFLREAYKDPMNPLDGSWRLIYVGSGGQLLGSLCWRTLAEFQAAQMGVSLRGSAPNLADSHGTLPGVATAGSSGAQPSPVVPTCAMFGQGSSNSYQPQIIKEGGMLGGNLIGVAGVVDHHSIKDYMGADNYRYWEFIWNPQQGSQIAAPAPMQPPSPGVPENPKSPVQPGASMMPAPPAPGSRSDPFSQP